MTAAFYLSALVAVLSTALAITRKNAVHALIYLIVSLLAVGLVFFTLGASFVAALEVIIYAGAIMVLFVFVAMMLNVGPEGSGDGHDLLEFEAWLGPAALVIVLLVELVFVVWTGRGQSLESQVVGPHEVGLALFGPYLLGVELASMLLLAGVLGANHIGRRDGRER
jgi:NADH-quinone oxidoreductase subunit J